MCVNADDSRMSLPVGHFSQCSSVDDNRFLSFSPLATVGGGDTRNQFHFWRVIDVCDGAGGRGGKLG